MQKQALPFMLFLLLILLSPGLSNAQCGLYDDLWGSPWGGGYYGASPVGIPGYGWPGYGAIPYGSYPMTGQLPYYSSPDGIGQMFSGDQNKRVELLRTELND